jgi:hypothetical protein
MTALTWFDLSKQPDGTRVKFASDWDIFPECVVPKGTSAVIKENGLNDIWCAMLVLPDDPELRVALLEWDGHIHLSSPDLDPGNSAHDAWYDESPLQLEAE